MINKEEPIGRAKGGKARAEKLSPEARSEIARKGGLARHAKRDVSDLPRAKREGVIRIGDVEMQCAVLADNRRVLTQSGVMVALGRARQVKSRKYFEADVNLPAFLQAKNLKPFISNDLEVTSSRIEFVTKTGGTAFGYSAELLPKVCDVFIEADRAGKLNKTQMHISDRARILYRGFATLGIIALVDEATGHQEDRARDALQQFLEQFLRKELAAWVKKFPDEFYENIYKLRGWVWPGMAKNRYSVVGHYTRDLVFERLAPGLLPELERRSPKNEKGERKGKLHQWLTADLGDPLLSQHMHTLIMFQRLAIANGHGWNKFVKTVDQVLPKRNTTIEMNLEEPNDPSAVPPPSSQSLSAVQA